VVVQSLRSTSTGAVMIVHKPRNPAGESRSKKRKNMMLDKKAKMNQDGNNVVDMCRARVMI